VNPHKRDWPKYAWILDQWLAGRKQTEIARELGTHQRPSYGLGNEYNPFSAPARRSNLVVSFMRPRMKRGAPKDAPKDSLLVWD